MIAVIQRVLKASVEIDNSIYSKIEHGYLVLLGIKKGDSEINAQNLAKKIVDLRIFEDNNGKMNLNISDVDGEMLVISQFTLCTDNEKSGNRPSFYLAELPEKAEKLYECFINKLKQFYIPEKVKTGKFAKMMNIHLINQGPVTIILEK